MRHVRFSLLIVLVVVGLAFPAMGQDNTASVEEAFDEFWAAASPAAAERLVDAVVDTGVTFENAYERLSEGRDYQPQATGILAMNNRDRWRPGTLLLAQRPGQL